MPSRPGTGERLIQLARYAVRKLLARRSAQLAKEKGVVEVWSEYLSWLSFANAGMLARSNVDCFDFAIKNRPSNAPVVEIGSFCGLSTNVLTYLLGRNGAPAPLFTCDSWIFEGSESGTSLGDASSVSRAAYREFVKETFVRNVRMFSAGALPHTIEVRSDGFFERWARAEEATDVFGRTARLGGPISFCYIDANHTYAGAKSDFENCDRFLERGGHVLFDDSADGSQFEVNRLVQELRSSPGYELVAKNPNYFFRKR